MKDVNKIDIVRWLLLGPVVFICSALSFGLGIFFFEDILSIKMYQNGVFVLGVVSFLSVLVWLLLSYLIAPKHKKKVVWISYVLGSVFIILISALIIGDSSGKNLEVVSLLVSSLSTGFIFSLVVQVKSTSKFKNLQDFINKNITSSN